MGNMRVVIVYKDGSFIEVSSGEAWEYQNDSDWDRTISDPVEIEKFLAPDE